MPIEPSQEPRSRRGRDVALLLTGVLCVHLIAAYAARHGVVRDDAESYVLLGRNLAHGFGYVFAPGRLPTAWRAPGYPLLLATIFRLTGGALWAARAANALLWVITSLLAYRLALQILPGTAPRMSQRVRHATALLVAGMIGFYPEFVGLTGLLWSESLFIPLFLGAVSALYAFSRRQNTRTALLAGAMVGAAALTRSTSVVLIPVIWYCVFRNGLGATRSAALNGFLATAAAMLLIGCWSARNYLVMGRFILVESNIGYNLYVGNRPDTPIPFAWTRAATLPRDPLYQRLTSGGGEAATSAALSHAALEQIKRNPVRTLALAAGKTFDFWLPDFFVALNLRSGSLGAENVRLWRPVLALSVLAYLVTVLAALAGIVRGHRVWEVRFLVLILCLYTLPHVLVYGASRYHLPLMPLLILLAAPVLRRTAIALRRAALRPPPAPDAMAPLTARPWWDR